MTDPAPGPIVGHERAVRAITSALEAGLQHPGNPANKTPPTTVVHTLFRTHGYPPKTADAIRASNQLLAESIIYLIENDLDSVIITKTELAQLKSAKDQQ